MASLLGLSAILLLFGAIQCLRPPLDELLDLVDQNVIINPKFRRGDGIHSERNATAVKQPNTAERLSKHFELIHFRPREVMSQFEGDWVCIMTDKLCNGVPDCPNGEDEDPTDCMYFKAIQHQNAQLRRIIVSHYEQYHQQKKRSYTDSTDDLLM